MAEGVTILAGLIRIGEGLGDFDICRFHFDSPTKGPGKTSRTDVLPRLTLFYKDDKTFV